MHGRTDSVHAQVPDRRSGADPRLLAKRSVREENLRGKVVLSAGVFALKKKNAQTGDRTQDLRVISTTL